MTASIIAKVTADCAAYRIPRQSSLVDMGGALNWVLKALYRAAAGFWAAGSLTTASKLSFSCSHNEPGLDLSGGRPRRG